MTDTMLSNADRERLAIIKSCIARDIPNAVASARLNLKKRQVQNLKRAVEKYGDRGIMHGNTFRSPWNATGVKTKKEVVSFLKKKDHRDFGPTFAQEQLREQNGIVLSRETVRGIMIEHDLWKEKKRAGPAIHRQWRERKAMYGELVQFDGSYHVWLEDGQMRCFLGSIDDATGTTPQGAFDDNEGVHAVFRFWWRYVETHGRPVALYMDKFSTYKINHTSAVDNAEMMTQFRRAMEDLGINVICANSPQAKGRIERFFKTLQDRLVKEMRLAGVKDNDRANTFFKETYLPDHNARFAVEARMAGDAHRPLTNELRARLPSIFSVQSKRNVNNDFTIQFKNRWYQLFSQQPISVYRGDVVTIEERLDGTIHVRLKDAYLSFATIGKLERTARPRVAALTRQKPMWKPPADHPWRRAAAHAAETKKQKRLRNAR